MGAPRTLSIEQTREAKNRVHLAVLEGRLEQEIVSGVLREFPGVKRDTAVKWVREVYTTIAASCTAYEENRLQNLSLAEARLQFIYRRAIEKGDLVAAIKAHEQLMKLQCLWQDPIKAREGVRKVVFSGPTQINTGGRQTKRIEDLTEAELLNSVDQPLILTVDAARQIVEEQDGD